MAVLHCFSSSKELAQCGLDLNFFISFSGIVTFKSASVVLEIAKNMPLSKILIETDAPYLSPNPVRGTINEPKNCLYSIKFLANLIGKDYSELANITYKNSYTLFNKLTNWFKK